MSDDDYDPPNWPTQEEQDAIGYCHRCLTPKPYKEAPDLCAGCDRAIDNYLKGLSMNIIVVQKRKITVADKDVDGTQKKDKKGNPLTKEATEEYDTEFEASEYELAGSVAKRFAEKYHFPTPPPGAEPTLVHVLDGGTTLKPSEVLGRYNAGKKFRVTVW